MIDVLSLPYREDATSTDVLPLLVSIRRHSSSPTPLIYFTPSPAATTLCLAVVFHVERPPRRASPEPQETRKDLELTRVHSHRAQMALAHHADAIRLLAKDRRSLRLQRAKNVATITRLREKIRTLEVTVRTQQDQIQEMEEDGEDIQGGDDFLSDDNDFEDDEFTDEEDYEFLEAAEDGIIPIDVDEDPEE
ncbi:hypothetical protein QYE76_011519 [Lolium multiflorum]|uniref:Uncharacterized protein n=1 Tax=Lolium multiflorum TaxID=4521 RepID=A0AAD8TXJ3_LOLMU|nr:hypothetical protein QYE76_011519 [Lolium multiflorum]